MIKIKYFVLLLFSYIAVPLFQKFWYYVYLLWLAWMWYWYGVNNQWHAKKIIYNKYLFYEEEFIIFDVWANIWQTIDETLESNFGKYKIYSFEPQEFNFKILKQKYSHYKHINLCKIWFSNMCWEFEFYKNIEWDTWWTLVSNSWHNKIKEIIQIKTIDDFCVENNIKKINYLKMDIEWSEFNALIWAKNMINEWKIDAIEFEFLWQNITARVFMKDFWDLLSEKYDFYRILPHHIYKINSYSHLLEIYCLSNFVCIKKWLKKK